MIETFIIIFTLLNGPLGPTEQPKRWDCSPSGAGMTSVCSEQLPKPIQE